MRAEVGQTGVQSRAVVEGFDVIEDRGAGVSESSKALMVDQLVFEAAPEGFDEGVVIAVALAAHGSNQAMLSEHMTVSGTGKLAAAIGVEDEIGSRAALGQRHAQGGNGQGGVQQRTHRPADDAPAFDIEHGNKV